MQTIYSLWQSFKAKPDEWFFYAFLLVSPLSIRKILYFIPINGKYNEFTSISLYASDIILAAVIINWLIKLYNNNRILSRSRETDTTQLFHACLSGRRVEQFQKQIQHNCSTPACPVGGWNNFKNRYNINVPRGTFGSLKSFFKKIYTQLIHRDILFFPLILVILSFLSTAWAQEPGLAIFRSVKLLEFYLLFLYVYYKFSSQKINVPRGTITDTRCSINGKMFHACLSGRQAEQLPTQDVRSTEKCSTPTCPVGKWNNYRHKMFGQWKNVPRGTFWLNSLLIIIISGVLHSILAIFQSIFQVSVGLFWLKESIISPEMVGVAKVVFGGETWIRAYGLFPHPNVFGGFLVFSIVSTIFYFELIFFSTNVPRGTFEKVNGTKNEKQKNGNCSTWNNLYQTLFCSEKNVSPQHKCSTWNILRSRQGATHSQSAGRLSRWTIASKIMFHVEHYLTKLIMKWLILAIQILAIILTFSKSAILGLIIAIVYIIYKIGLLRRNCSTWNNFSDKNHWEQNIESSIIKKQVRREENIPKCSTWNILCDKGGAIKDLVKRIRSRQIRKVLLVFFISIALFTLIKPNYYSLVGRSVEDRLVFFNVAYETFIENPIIGIGAGQYVINLLNLDNVLTWQYQPVHNVFLLILNELGLVGLIIFFVFLYKLFHACLSGRQVEQLRKQFQQNCSTPACPVGRWNNFAEVKQSNRNIENVPRGTFEYNEMMIYVKGLLLALICISFLDHYLWDIQQGQILLWITLGILAGERQKKNYLDKT